MKPEIFDAVKKQLTSTTFRRPNDTETKEMKSYLEENDYIPPEVPEIS